MPIISSLGALEFPRTVSTVFGTGDGFASLTQPASGNIIINSGYYGASCGADSGGNMYAGGQVGTAATTASSYMLKLDANGNAIYDGLAYAGFNYGAAVTTSDQVYYAGRLRTLGPSPYYYEGIVSSPLGSGNSSKFFGPVVTGAAQNFGTMTIDTTGNLFYTYTSSPANVCIGYSPTNFVSMSASYPVGTTSRSVAMCQGSSGNYYHMTTQNLTTNNIVKYQSSGGTIAWKVAINTQTISMAADANYVYIATRTGSIIQLDASTGAITRQYDLAGGSGGERYVIVGDNGYIYSVGREDVTCLDSAGNIVWSNRMWFQGALGGDTQFVAFGVAQRDGYVYVNRQAFYNGRYALFNFKVPDDGTLPEPGAWWLGDKGYVIYTAYTTSKSSTSFTSTASTITASGGTLSLPGGSLGGPVLDNITTGAPI